MITQNHWSGKAAMNTSDWSSISCIFSIFPLFHVTHFTFSPTIAQNLLTYCTGEAVTTFMPTIQIGTMTFEKHLHKKAVKQK